MPNRPKPLPPQSDEVVFGVSSVLLTGSAPFWASGDDVEAARVDLGGGRRGGVPAIEAWRQAVRRDLGALGLQTKSAIFDEGRRAGVYLAELDELEAHRAGQEAMVEHGAAGAAKRELELRMPLFDRYRANLPVFVQRRHAEALEAAKAKAQRGVDAMQDLYGR